ncbi:MAG: hypothetical protein KIS94_06120 [Chitinophagales bacterium]|nr:hypothetical protein [Chitinophagales bacterium]
MRFNNLLLPTMKELNFTIVQRKATPLVQLVVALVVGWAGMGVVKLVNAPAGTEYFAAFLGIIFFTLINTVASIANRSWLQYTLPSYGLYAVMVAVLFLSAKFLSGISIWDLWEYRMMLTSITLFYFIISTLVRAVRFILDMVEA